MAHVFQAEDLERKVASLFVAAGSLPAEAQQVAANLVLANLSGHDSHGIGMAPRYVEAILEGGLIPNTKVAVKVDTGMMLGLDGQRGYGQIVGVQAALTFSLSKGSGVGLTKLTVDYKVSGSSLSGLDALAPVVDGVLKEQVTRLAAGK